MKKAKRTMDDLSVKAFSAVQNTSAAPLIKSRFWRIYTAVLIVFCFLVIASIVVVNFILRDYESARPSYVAESVFQQFFKTDDYQNLLQQADFQLSIAETSEDFARFWNEQTKGELSYVRVSADNGGDTVRYNVRSGEKTFAAFELALSGNKTFFGNSLYELSKIQLGVGAKNKVKVSVPSNSVVYVNGVQLGEQQVVESEIQTSSSSHMPDGVEGVVYTTYALSGLLYEPDLLVVDEYGVTHELEYDTANSMHVAKLNYNEELKTQMSDYVIEAAQTYAAAMQNDRPRAVALSYLEKGTDLYKQTSELTLFVSEHTGYRFEKVVADEFYAYDENTFSCRVSFVHVLTGGSTRFDQNGENRENVDITWYFRKVGNKYLIYDRENS